MEPKRRLRLTVVVAALAVFAAPTFAVAANNPDLTRYVNPFAGTDAGAPNYGTGGGAANTTPAATVPFGMIQWGPDTVPSDANQGSGYSYRDTRLRGFSLTHMSGAGCPIYRDFAFLPTTTPVTASPVVAGGEWNPALVPSYSHAHESARPGYYQVLLGSSATTGINAELTATAHAGIGRFSYPPTSPGGMLINAGGSATENTAASVQIDPGRQEVTGSTTSGEFCGEDDSYTVYFAARFDRPFTAYGTWRRQTLTPGSTSDSDQSDASAPAQSGAYVNFATAPAPVVGVRVAISYVSAAAARNNLDAEAPTQPFDQVRASASDAWNDMLGRIRVTGGARRDIRMFYTALYHALLEPRVFSDADGTYLGMDGQVHPPDGHVQYADYSGWDVYRSEIPLVALLAPARAADMAQSLVADARESGCLPKWSVANGQTVVMVGDSADPIIAGADAFGATGFDRGAALADMVNGATRTCQSTTNGTYTEREGLDDYLKLGYIPSEDDVRQGNADGRNADGVIGNPSDVWGAAATTLEYATDDFAIAAMAARLGDAGTARAFVGRSLSWRNLLDPATHYVETRSRAGAFAGHHPGDTTGFVEGSGAQYTWAVPHDLADLFAVMGGPAATSRRLDAFLSSLNAGPRSEYAFLGNEPTLGVPWEYDWLGQAYKTQRVVRRALLSLYHSDPGGYPGNDDLGEMSSWYVFAALGMYPAVPGTDLLALDSPLFRRAVIHRPGGDVVIDAPLARRIRPYVHRLTLNGTCLNQSWVRYSWLAAGGHLVYGLSSVPDPGWAAAPNSVPPSLTLTGPSGPLARC